MEHVIYQIHSADFPKNKQNNVINTIITKTKLIPSSNSKEFWAFIEFYYVVQSVSMTVIKEWDKDDKKNLVIFREAAPTIQNPTDGLSWYDKLLVKNTEYVKLTETMIINIGNAAQAKWFKENYGSLNMDPKRFNKYLLNRIIAHTRHDLNIWIT
jgi:hypothetical protein